MFHLEDVLQLKDEEDVKLFVRRHPFTMLGHLGLSLLFIVIPFFFLFPLFGYGTPGIIVFLISVMIGIGLAMRTLIMWDADVFLLTTRRVINVDQRGVWSRFVTEAALSEIQDVRWERKGLLHTMSDYGSVAIQASGLGEVMLVRDIPHPQQVHELMNDIRHTTTPKRTHLSPEQHERIRKLMQVLEELPPEALEKVEGFAKEQGRVIAMERFLEPSSKT